MNKHILPVVLLSLISLASCKNTPTPPKPDIPVSNEDSTKSSIPDPNDLLHTLQGRWQNEEDTNYTLEIADTQMRHLKNGKLSYQSMIDIDGACESPVCRPDGEDTSDGWCFTEMTVENGKYGAQCNFVIDCDTSRLRYRSLSGSRIERSFKKIQ
ncbi:MAG: hypothetical protein IPH31_04515 [Lewinellaceae bacterium]|nr:hypothetical protein [Lewinellaceae bacterium]